ncbi:MAG TPA: hypothetical protein VGN14_13895 [Candidatus Elarobacter sp.]
MHRSFVLLIAACAFALPAAVRAADDPTKPLSALERRGFVTDRATAERAISFRPFVPDRSPSEVALIPPFHGGQLSKYEGIAYEYGRHGRSWILQQWPQNGGNLSAFAPLPREQNCSDVHAIGGKRHPRGVAWTTPRGLAFSLTPDGGADPRTIVAEFRRLVKLGACR